MTDPRSPALTPGIPRLPILYALTSVRFFAAFHVALYHLVRPFSRWALLAGAMSVGYTGVSFFFVLSGFILTYSHAAEYERGRGNPRKFWVARLARVYPVYLVSMLVAALVYYAQFRSPIHIIAYVADLLLVQSWSMRMINFFNSSAWTLSTEAFFYLVFPFVLMAIRPRTRSAAIGWIVFFFLLAMLGPLVCLRLYPAASMTEAFTPVAGDARVFLVNRLPLLALPEFLAGMSIGWLFLRFKPTQKTSAILVTAGAFLMVIALIFAGRLPYVALHNGLFIPIYTLLLLGLSQANWLTRLLSGKLLVLLGEASYSLYLIHSIVGSFLKNFGYDDSIAEACLSLVLLVALAVLMHLYIERPCRRFVLAWWAGRHPAQLKVV
jgi:peptidoglycan/LPS O-acetylase OafA/YrhL